MTFTRITVRADPMGGVPCIRGLRIPVATVVGMIAEGMTAEEVLDAYPDLELADVQEALHYAAEAVRERAAARRVRFLIETAPARRSESSSARVVEAVAMKQPLDA